MPEPPRASGMAEPLHHLTCPTCGSWDWRLHEQGTLLILLCGNCLNEWEVIEKDHAP